MRFPSNFTTSQKIKFYTQRNKNLTKEFNKFKNTNKIEHLNKIKSEIEIALKELTNLNK